MMALPKERFVLIIYEDLVCKKSRNIVSLNTTMLNETLFYTVVFQFDNNHYEGVYYYHYYHYYK